MSSALDHSNASSPRISREPLVANGVASVNRLSVLRTIFDETAARFSKAIFETTGNAVDFQVEDILAIRVGETKDIDALLSVASVYDAPDLQSKVAVAISMNLALSLIDLLFGSNVSIPFTRADRGLTKVESRAAEFATAAIIDSFQASLSKVVSATFKLERVEAAVDWLTLARKGSVIVLCKCKLQALGRQGDAILAIPRSALDPFRDALSRDPNAKGNVEDAAWARKLRGQVVKAAVTVSATMEKRGLTLGDVAQFHVGQIIELPFSPTSLIPLESANRRLFSCELGQKDGFYTVRVEEKIDGEQEFLSKIIGDQT